MNPSDPLEIIVITILEPAVAGAMPETEAEGLHEAPMKYFEVLQNEQSKSADALAAEIQRSLKIAGGPSSPSYAFIQRLVQGVKAPTVEEREYAFTRAEALLAQLTPKKVAHAIKTAEAILAHTDGENGKQAGLN